MFRPRENFVRKAGKRLILGKNSFRTAIKDFFNDLSPVEKDNNIEIIEVKYVTKWKEAIGQIIAYGQYYPDHQKRIHLFGVDNNNQSKLTLIKQHCLQQNIRITWEF